MIPYIDLHTHQRLPVENVISVYNRLLHEDAPLPDLPFSAGLHPWYADQLTLEELSNKLDRCLVSPNMIALGETGLDKVCESPFQLQKDVFELHLKKAVEGQLPVILHCVKAWEELIEMCSNYPVTKILHGYNGSIELTNRLVQKGFIFSIGRAITDPASKIRASIQRIPVGSIFCETDNSTVSIETIYEEVCAALKMEEEDLRSCLFDNYTRIRSA